MAHQQRDELPVKEHSERELADQVLLDRMEQIKHKILVLSGKGGVDKSTGAHRRASAGRDRMMSNTKPPWVIVLAAGEGNRVRALTRDCHGHPAPKQFTSVDGRTTLLGATLRRARRIAPPERIVTIVAAQHERWWKSELTGMPRDNIIVQPENRGTAAGILLPELWVARHDDSATVVVLPSDHYVESEDILINSLNRAVSAVVRSEAPVVLLGIRPTSPEEEYGWIVPCPGPTNCPHRVACFREKPDACTAASLLNRGGLLNTFIIVADSRCLLGLYKKKVPELWQRFRQTAFAGSAVRSPQNDLADLYRSIPTKDFSRDILEAATEELWVYPVPSCGWTDLGTPQRLTDHLVHHGRLVRANRTEAALG
jgi:mannose-1-phosphate guanylyltransferase